jgi:hypothetical protein
MPHSVRNWDIAMVKEQEMFKKHSHGARFQEGDWAFFVHGLGKSRVQVVEDIGPLGVNGRILYLVRRDNEGGESDTFQVREENLIPAKPPRAHARRQYTSQLDKVVWSAHPPRAHARRQCARR